MSIERRTAATSETLGATFDPRRNALNVIRLALAASVIVWHSFPISGNDVEFAPLHQLMERGGVDSFFAVSGFLIVSSWVRRPEWFSFLKARVLRIFPAFWVCLILTAVVFAPLSILMRGVEYPPGFTGDAVGYVFSNFLLRMNQYDIAGTPAGVPLPGVWDGSLWTLFWEFLCYIGVLAVGLAGLLKLKATLPLAFLLALAGVFATVYGPIDNFWLDRSSRLGLLFLAGALVYQYQDRLPVRWPWLVGAALVVGGSLWLPDYRVVAALPLAYLVISLGALGKHPRLHIKNDFSYGTYIYGVPMQQLLATAGAASLGVPLFALLSILATLPVAIGSWFLIEKPALSLKGPKRAGPTPAPRPGGDESLVPKGS